MMWMGQHQPTQANFSHLMKQVNENSVSYVSPDASLLQALLPTARRIFTDTFASLYDREAFEAFCDQVYAVDGSMSKDFSDPAVRWRVAISKGEPIGYAKLTPLRAPALNPSPNALELQQIYVLSDWHGTGVAQELMAWVISTASGLGSEELYLTVFDHNDRAKRFYGRCGFHEVGRCTFTLGDRIDDDRIWCKPLAGTSNSFKPPPLRSAVRSGDC